MKTARIIAGLALASVFAVTDVEWTTLGPEISLLGSPAQAVIGRPFTPMSMAGVARRTTRRAFYATTIYRATLPNGCVAETYDGKRYYNCNGTYYRKSGGRYNQVKIQY